MTRSKTPSASEADLPRPSPGPLFPAALSAWAAAFVAEWLTWQVFTGRVGEWACPVACLAGGLAVLLVAFLRRDLLGAVAVFAAVLVVGVLVWHSWQVSIGEVSDALADGEVVAEVTGDVTERDYGLVSEARVRAGGRWVELRLLWPDADSVQTAGSRLRLRGRLSEPTDTDGGRWNHRNGYAGMLAVSSVERDGQAKSLGGLVGPFRDASAQLLERLGGNASTLLEGVLLGNRTSFRGTELEQAFRVTGLAHLMAVSGTHLGVVAALAAALLGLTPLARRHTAALVVAAIVGYVALTGFAPSAMRAGTMCTAALVSPLFNRRRDSLSALWLCVVVFLGLDPTLAFSTGYLLSVLSIIGLLVFAPLVAAWLGCFGAGKARVLSAPVSATLSASLATYPVALPLFSQLPLISPLSNLLAAPLVTAMLGLGIPGLLLSGAAPPVGHVFLMLAGTVANACAWLVGHLSELPGACVPLDAHAPVLGAAFAAAALALWAAWPLPQGSDKRRRMLALGAAALPPAALLALGLGGAGGCANALIPAVDSDAQIVMLDVGQGDAMLIRDGDAALLIDTGEEGSVLLKALARQGVTRLSAVMLTHKDADHVGALPALQGVVAVGHVFIHADLLSYGGEEEVLESAQRVTSHGAEGLHVGDVIHVGRFSVTLISPLAGGTSENEDSLVTLVEFDEDGDGTPEARGLTTGDAEAPAIEKACSLVGDIDFVKVPHHGSDAAFTAAELAALRPEVALIGVGADNPYGHPKPETLEMLGAAGARVYRTDTDGDIVVSFAHGRMGVRTQRRVAGSW